MPGEAQRICVCLRIVSNYDELPKCGISAPLSPGSPGRDDANPEQGGLGIGMRSQQSLARKPLFDGS